MESQEAECRAVCEREGWEVKRVLCDNDRSASKFATKERPEFKKLEKILKSGDVLVCWEASRLTRDMGTLIALRDLCLTRGVLLSYGGQMVDLDDIKLIVDGMMAEQEAKRISQRVLRGKKAAALDGRPGGRPPFGYRRVLDPDTGKTTGWEIDPVTGPIVRDIIGRALEGKSLWAIARGLNKRGIEPPQLQSNSAKDWVPARIRSTIVRPTYAGLRVYQGAVVGQGNWEPMISVEEHERLKTLLLDPSRLSHRGVEARHLLSGIAVCGKCKKPVRVLPPSKRGTTRAYGCPGSCFRRQQNLTDLLVERTLINRLSRDDAAEIFTPRDTDNTEDLQKLEELRIRLNGYIDQAIHGKITDSAFARIEAGIQAQIEELEEKTKPKHINPLVAKLIGPNAGKKWAHELTIHEQRDVVRALLTIKIHQATHGTSRRFDPRDISIKWIEHAA